MTPTDVVFRAISHPARRKIMGLLSESSRSVKQLTTAFAMSQPAVSQHLRELKEAHLVTSERVGAERIYRLTPEPIRIVLDWSSEYKRFLDPAGHAWAFVGVREGKPREGERAVPKGGEHGR